MSRRRVAFRNKRQNRLGLGLVTMVVLMILVVVSVKGLELKQQQENYLQKEEQLMTQIASEEKRAVELEEYKKYTQTKAYIEEVAKEKYGLVREGEIIFETK